MTSPMDIRPFSAMSSLVTTVIGEMPVLASRGINEPVTRISSMFFVCFRVALLVIRCARGLVLCLLGLRRRLRALLRPGGCGHRQRQQADRKAIR